MMAGIDIGFSMMVSSAVGMSPPDLQRVIAAMLIGGACAAYLRLPYLIVMCESSEDPKPAAPAHRSYIHTHHNRVLCYSVVVL